MRSSLRAVLAMGFTAFLAACGGGSSGSGSSASNTSTVTLAAGSTTTLAANSTVHVPAGTTVTAPNGTSVSINGSSDTIVTQAGAIVTVPASATGPANDVVTTVQTTTGTAATSPLSATALAGSATTNSATVDGTGASAVFWGGGHLTTDASSDIILSDRDELRKVTQSGVVTTLTTQGLWNGVALDASGDIYGSGNVQTITGSPTTFGATLEEFSAAGTYQQLFANWETSSSFSALSGGGMVMDSLGALYQVDEVNNRIVKFNIASNTWTVLAGSGTAGNADGVGTAATFTFTTSNDLAIDSNNNLYVTSLNTIRKIAPDGTVTTILNQLPLPYSGTIAVDKSGNVYTAGVGEIYQLSSSGSLVSYPFTNTTDTITSLTTDSSGNLYAGTRGTGAQIFKITFPTQ